MTHSYLGRTSTPRATPQSEPIPGRTDMVANTAGGYTFELDALGRLRRWLILGSEGGTYYAGERDLTRQNVHNVNAALTQHGAKAVDLIVEVSEAGRAPKNDPAIYALAVAASYGNLEVTGPRPPKSSPHRARWEYDLGVRQAAWEALPRVCRTGAHLLMFIEFADGMRGWGRGLREAVARWYGRDIATVAYQLVKYRQRGGWSHRDVLRLSHPRAGDDLDRTALFHWVTQGIPRLDNHAVIEAFTLAQEAKTPRETADLIRGTRGQYLTHEMLVTEHKTDPDVNRALLERGMPMTALIRNLGNLTRYDVLKPLGSHTKLVCDQLTDADHIRRARVHPITVLAALTTYASGRGARGSNFWTPVQQVVDALDAAFYAAFDNVEATSKSMMLALDVSGSMHYGEIAGVPGLTPAMAAAALAMVHARSGDPYLVFGFGGTFAELPVSASQRLDDVVALTRTYNFGSTDCSLPMIYASKRQLEVDGFLILTDNETWAGGVHPAQALAAYRRNSQRDARCAVAAMTATEFTIADPADPGMMDVVGFDTSAPQLIAEFFAGRL